MFRLADTLAGTQAILQLLIKMSYPSWYNIWNQLRTMEEAKVV